MSRVLIVPAAGLGSRLKTALPKVLVPVAGQPMIGRLLELFAPWVSSVVVVAHPAFEGAVRDAVRHACPAAAACHVVLQPAPTGMLDAILAAAPAVDRRAERIWIVWCDQVGVLPATLARLAAADAAGAAAVVPTVQVERPYIHFPRDAAGRIAAVRQRREGDEMPPAGESDMGLFSLSPDAFLAHLPAFAAGVLPGTGTAERNFLPFIPWLAARERVDTIDATDPREAVGINTPEDLRFVEDWLQARAHHQ